MLGCILLGSQWVTIDQSISAREIRERSQSRVHHLKHTMEILSRCHKKNRQEKVLLQGQKVLSILQIFGLMNRLASQAWGRLLLLCQVFKGRLLGKTEPDLHHTEKKIIYFLRCQREQNFACIGNEKESRLLQKCTQRKSFDKNLHY